MTRVFLLAPLLVLAACKPQPQPPAALTGRITFNGPKPTRAPVNMDADGECVNLHKSDPKSDESLIVSDKGELADVFVYLKTGLEEKSYPPPAEAVVIDQKGCWFQPRVLGIQTGQSLKVTNSDPVTHNIHPQPSANREWNASQAPSDPPVIRRFARAELLFPVKCNIHNWMRAFIGVVPHPYFAVTKVDGSFSIANIPPGSYTIAAIHPTLGAQEQTIALQPSQKQDLSFTFKGK